MEMPVRYLCSDDETGRTTGAYKTKLEKQSSNNLKIEITAPDNFEKEVGRLSKTIREEGYSGLLLDLRLDGTGKAHYRATSLVQEIHTRAAEGEFPICPLALWSNDKKLRDSYSPDETSHDLFDIIISKDKLSKGNYAKDKALKLVSLAIGYEHLSDCKVTGIARVESILGGNEQLVSGIDPRIIYPLSVVPASIYEQARFVHQQLLSIPNNALVSSELLAARLGIDYASTPTFDSIALELFPSAKYTGLFSEGWSCWWMAEVEQVWETFQNCPGPLKRLSAEKRVAFINSHLNRTDLSAAKPIKFASSTAYWSICQITRKPIDPREGYVVNRQLLPWQLTQYVSLYGKLDGSSASDEYDVNPLDMERFKSDKVRLIKK